MDKMAYMEAKFSLLFGSKRSLASMDFEELAMESGRTTAETSTVRPFNEDLLQPSFIAVPSMTNNINNVNSAGQQSQQCLTLIPTQNQDTPAPYINGTDFSPDCQSGSHFVFDKSRLTNLDAIGSQSPSLATLSALQEESHDRSIGGTTSTTTCTSKSKSCSARSDSCSQDSNRIHMPLQVTSQTNSNVISRVIAVNNNIKKESDSNSMVASNSNMELTMSLSSRHNSNPHTPNKLQFLQVVKNIHDSSERCSSMSMSISPDLV